MTSKQIEKALKKAGIELNSDIEISKDEVTICVGYFESNGYGRCNGRKTSALSNKVSKSLGGWSSFSTGYGASILRPCKNIDMGDWNDTSSRHHY